MADARKKRFEDRTGKISLVEKILIFIKHHFHFLWQIIEWGNGLLFYLFYNRKLRNLLPTIFHDNVLNPFSFRILDRIDETKLVELIRNQNEDDLKYFKPHGFDLESIRKQFARLSFLMMGVFDNEKLIGYFFLRFFTNSKCFVGRLIDKQCRGRGIGEVMNSIMYQTAWKMNFRCLSTISRKNLKVMRSHSRNPHMVILRELGNDYLLVEFISEKPDNKVNA